MRAHLFLLTFLSVLVPGMALGTSCVGANGETADRAQCCPDLVFEERTGNPLGVCQIPNSRSLQYCAPPVAPALTSATVCSTPGHSCLPQREEDLYPETPDDSPLPESENDETRKDEGDLCEFDTECESFLCAADTSGVKVCQERLVCRLAEAGEFAPAPAQCEPGLIKSREFNPDTNRIEDDVCIDNTAASPFPDIDPNLFNQTSRCSYEIPASKGDKRFSSMVSLRAFEILFSQATDDKLKLKTYLRDEIAKPLAEGRKRALDEYNEILRGIEKDEELLKGANPESPGQVTIHGSETLSERDLALRRVSGRDMLLIMWRRNLLNMNYERRLFELVSQAAQKLAVVNENIKSWRSKHKKWKIASEGSWASVENGGKKIKKSYTTRHRIKPKTAALNSGAFEKPGVGEFFSVLAEGGTSGALPKKKFYLLDAPFMSSDGASFGSTGPLQRNLSGTSRITSVEGIYDDFGPKIASYYKSLLPAREYEFYVFEPEMVDLGEKNCFLASGELSDACPKFKRFLEGVQGAAFAEFIAYGAHKKGKYKKFFERSNTLRLRLLKTLEVEFQTIAQYYEELNTSRIAQNSCFEDNFSYVSQGLTDSNSNNEVQNDTQGPQGGSSEALGAGSGSGSGSLASVGSSTGPSNALRGSSLTALPEAIRLAQSRIQGSLSGEELPQSSQTKFALGTPNLSTNTVKSSVANGSSSTATGAQGLAGSALASANALNREKLSSENTKLQAKSSSAEKRSEEIRRGFSSLAASSRISRSGAISDSTPESTLSGSFSSGTASALSKDSTSEGASATVPGAQASSAGTTLGGTPAISESSYGEAGASGSGTLTAQNAGVDATGMNEEDKDVLMRNLERTRSRYDGQETDELFERVSKAYVRNLHRILKRKKMD